MSGPHEYPEQYAKDVPDDSSLERGRLSESPPWAPHGSPYAYSPPPMFEPRSESFGASLPSGLTFLAGVWLASAPFALDYAGTGAGRPGYWNDVVLGVAIAMLALVRTVAPREVPWFSLVNVVLGGWLVAAPFVLDYNEGQDASRAVVNDVVVGIIVVALAVISATITFRRRRSEKERAGHRR